MRDKACKHEELADVRYLAGQSEIPHHVVNRPTSNQENDLRNGERWLQKGIGGGRGIRTPGTFSGTTVFKTAGINRSPIPPREEVTSKYCNPGPFAARIPRPRYSSGEARNSHFERPLSLSAFRRLRVETASYLLEEAQNQSQSPPMVGTGKAKQHSKEPRRARGDGLFVAKGLGDR